MITNAAPGKNITLDYMFFQGKRWPLKEGGFD